MEQLLKANISYQLLLTKSQPFSHCNKLRKRELGPKALIIASYMIKKQIE
jgi:hypothetical protein